ncbi:hypothetical protein [Edaphocola flava]|jgi:hypothetical protein|uniref:hypothetical protein n=1 Tax=Edaphocola flava TaxID=2499629 RepID=UPI00100AA127|nr:hypothetical protein [Edaphocola flava]
MFKKLLSALLVLVMATGAATAQQNNYGPNIIRIMPLTAFNGGVGLGASYERILDKDGKIGLNIPFSLGFRNNGDYNNDMNATFMVNPGIKFYPGGQRKVTYALGASLFASFGTNNGYRYDINQSYQYVNANTLQAGIMVNNYLQFNLSPKVNIGLELGVGPAYIDQERDVTNHITYNNGLNVMGQFSFHIGFRF